MRRLLAGMLVTAALLLGAAPAGTRAGTPPRTPLLGIVPHLGATFAPRTLAAASHSGPLVYHGGSTMRTNAVYAIYWSPSSNPIAADYESAINQYFTDVAAASGSTTNVYSVATQYYDTTGSIAYSSTFGGAYVDTTPFPASGCNDGSDPVCLTDPQLQTEIQSVITLEHWPTGLSSLFFVMTPDSVGICSDSSNAQCTTNAFCAYHNGFNGTTGSVIYAVAPYDATIGGGNSCWDGNSPNNNPADATIGTISHEQNEAITDPSGSGWYAEDPPYYDEMADLCVWQFGSVLGSTAYGQYNQVINGHYYWLQTEYSNDGNTCLQSYTPPPPPTDVSPPVVTGVAAVSKFLTTTVGDWTGSPTGYHYQWQRCTEHGIDCVDIPGETGTSYQLGTSDGGHTLRSEIVASNASGSSQPSVSEPTTIVLGLPAVKKKPRIFGRPTVKQHLEARKGIWRGLPTRYHYEWLRCTAHGRRCRQIHGARYVRYRIRKADIGHRLRVRVTASNAAGQRTALSRASRVVHH